MEASTYRTTVRLLGSGLCAAAGVLLASTAAGAAGTGYGTATPPPGASSVGFTTVVASQVVGASGGTVQGTESGATATVDVPAGALPSGGEVVLSSGPPSAVAVGGGRTVVVGFSVAVLNQETGQPLTGTFAHPLTLTLTDPAIVPGDTVVILTGPGQLSPVSGATVTNGSAVVAFDSDPNFAVVAGSVSAAPTPTSTTVPGATSVTTGEPFLGEELVAGVLVAGGLALGATAVRRRRRLS
jgi:hypothetical protein